MLSFVDVRAGRDSPRQATHFLLRRQKKVSKEKATLLSATLRFAMGTLRCSLRAGSAELASLKQLRPCFRPKLRSSAQTEGLLGRNTNSRTPEARAMTRPCFGIWYAVFCLPRPGWAEEHRIKRIRARACLSAASLRETPLGSSTASCPKRSEGTQTAGRLSFAYFSLARQRKVSRPPGRDPATRRTCKPARSPGHPC